MIEPDDFASGWWIVFAENCFDDLAHILAHIRLGQWGGFDQLVLCRNRLLVADQCLYHAVIESHAFAGTLGRGELRKHVKAAFQRDQIGTLGELSDVKRLFQES
ncbi:MAG: hypothetical protein AAB370_03075 [Verrucomicrobiota bacterium]